MSLRGGLLAKYKMEMQRQTAYKVWINEIVNGKYVIQEGWDPNYIEVNGKKISRVNIIANIINIYKNDESSYIALTADDGSGSIRLKAFNEDVKLFSDLNIGDTVLVIGRPRENNNEICILPEIIRKVDVDWIKVRKLELPKIQVSNVSSVNKSHTKEVQEERLVIEEEKVGEDSDSCRQRILDFITKFEDGVDEAEVINNIENSEDTIQELLKEGEIYKVKGKLRAL